jgi:hypothetical protein
MNAPISCIANAADRRLGALGVAPAEAGATAPKIRLKGGGRDGKNLEAEHIGFLPL